MKKTPVSTLSNASRAIRNGAFARRISIFLCCIVLPFVAVRMCIAQGGAASSDSRIARADELLRLGKPKDALAILNDLAATAPNTSSIEAKIGKAYFQSSQLQAAIPHLKVALKKDDSDMESVQLLALSYFGVSMYTEALPLLERLGPQITGSSADSTYLLASCYVMTQHWDDARKTYAKLFAVAPDSAMADLMFAKFLVRQRLEDRAVPEIKAALQKDPRIAMAHFLMGEIDLSRGDAHTAVDEFNNELAVNPAVWLVYWRLGDAYVRLEKYDDAEKVLQEAVWLNGTSTGPYILLGEVALRRNDPGRAAGYLERGAKLDPQNDYVHYFLGKAYQGLGRSAEANQQFTAARDLRNKRRADERPAPQ